MKKLLFVAAMAVMMGFTPNPSQYIKDKKQEQTIRSLSPVGNGSMYKMDFVADYKLQEFIDADLKTRGAVQAAVGEKLLNIPAVPKAGQMNPGCSVFQAVTPGKRGDVLVGRNFDYPFEDCSPIIIRTKPKKGYKSISIICTNFVGMQGAQLSDGKTDLSILMAAPYAQMDGVNEKGLSISVLALSNTDTPKQFDEGKHSVMTSVMMRMLLDRAKDVDQALELLRSINFFGDGNYHFLIADAKGRSVVVEYIKPDGREGKAPWEMKVYDSRYVTNFFFSEGWHGPKDYCWRYEKFAQRYTGRSNEDKIVHVDTGVEAITVSEAEAMELLHEVSIVPKKRTDSRTLWSVVYNLSKGTAKVCVGRDFEHVYEFSIKKF